MRTHIDYAVQSHYEDDIYALADWWGRDFLVEASEHPFNAVLENLRNRFVAARRRRHERA